MKGGTTISFATNRLCLETRHLEKYIYKLEQCFDDELFLQCKLLVIVVLYLCPNLHLQFIE